MSARIGASAGQLMAEARAITGIDIVDDEVAEPLAIYLKSLDEEGMLHAEGARGMRRKIVGQLCNRLRRIRDFRAHPEILDQIVDRPIIFCGFARTGSTKMQKLLAASGDFNFLPFWMGLNSSLHTGVPGESPRPRIDETEAFARWFAAGSPENERAHPFRTHEPEEDNNIIEQCFKTATVFCWAPARSYLAWLGTQDMEEQFRYLRDTFKYLQWQGLADPRKRWMVKCALYTGMEREVLAAFPDACLMMTHRDPAIVVASGLKVLECFYAPFCTSPVEPVPYTHAQRAAIDRHFHNRATIPGFRILDLDFRDVAERAEHAIEQAYEFAGESPSDASRRRMLEWNASHPAHAAGRLDYSLERYGLTPEFIAETFADYNRFLAERFGPR